MEINECRLGGPLVEVANFGNIVPTGWHVEPKQLAEHPLKLMYGIESGLLQLAHKTDPAIYDTYWYRSGTNESMCEALKDIVNHALKFNTGSGPWLDIAANDGTLLSLVPNTFFKIAVDPCKNIKNNNCNLFINDFFNDKVYLDKVGSKAEVITSIAVFYDLENPRDFVKQVKNILSNTGIWIIQMSYLPLMLIQNAFDNVCHEHVTYWSLELLSKLLKSEGLSVVDADINNVNGGSFRVVVTHDGYDPFTTRYDKDISTYKVESLLAHEQLLQLNDIKTYYTFFERCNSLKNETVQLLQDLRKDKKIVFGYGASTKGNTLLQWYGIDANLIPYIADRQVEKHGLFCAGSNISVCSESYMRSSKPDYLFILPWHFLSGFKKREKEYLDSGGKFIVPLPQLTIISK